MDALRSCQDRTMSSSTKMRRQQQTSSGYQQFEWLQKNLEFRHSQIGWNWNVIKQKHGFNQSHNGRTDAKVGLKQPDSLSFKTVFQKRLRFTHSQFFEKMPLFLCWWASSHLLFLHKSAIHHLSPKKRQLPCPWHYLRQPLGGSSRLYRNWHMSRHPA